MRIAIGADHGGYALKESLVKHVNRLGHEVLDVGTSSSEVVDYPTFARAVAEAVACGRCERGIMVDGAGIGSAMVANKVPGVRAALAYDISSARNSREHNDANVLTLGAGLIGPRLAEEILGVWLEAACTEDRHRRRVAQIEGGAAPPAAAPAGSSGSEISSADLDRIARELQKLLEGSAAVGPSVAESPDAARRLLALGARRIGSRPGAGRVPEDIAGYIDHTLLRPNATSEDIRKLCAEAREFRFAAVCVNPMWTDLVTRELRGTPVKTCSVVGFPLGATHGEAKAFEARRAIRDGAREIDMVIPIGSLKEGNDAHVLADIRAVVEASRDGGAICKVILETAFLNDEEKRRACRLARRAGAHFVKTSTGFGPGGATAADVALMAEAVAGAGMGVKASGGIRTYADAAKMIEAGATRIGASASVAIVQQARAERVGASGA
jgi:deoxyribose-phosphate aldolase